ncbi:MAG: SRPBCC domain-containing protein [Gemmatimonadetes bacterium]|nr:SRPBCC domain-containing protein [Gemmatimonadota bacterium]
MSDTPQDRTRTIEIEVEVDASPEDVWEAISEAEGIRRWFAPEARVTAGVGGSIWLSWGEGAAGEATIDVWEPSKRIRWIEEWGSSEDEGGATLTAVDFHIETRGGTTIVRLVHSGFSASADWDEYYDATVAGWTYFLWNLSHYLGRHPGTPRTMISDRRKTTRPFDEVWAALLGPAGLAVSSLDTLAAGDDLALRVGASSFSGETAYVRAPRNLAGTLKELNDGLIFIEMEPSGSDTWACGVWISAYGVDSSETDTVQRRLTELMDGVFRDG